MFLDRQGPENAELNRNAKENGDIGQVGSAQCQEAPRDTFILDAKVAEQSQEEEKAIISGQNTERTALIETVVELLAMPAIEQNPRNEKSREGKEKIDSCPAGGDETYEKLWKPGERLDILARREAVIKQYGQDRNSSHGIQFRHFGPEESIFESACL